ncbi:hypothetical protein PTSG_09507 [Salpingoeca rosetta]|uniref:Double-strand break repair protein n=1 Tax=Salpingoeca rosetta (strain ATCC 50818 / BSB-021) TaxID=946362 RepID=F2UL74_SALR5|nr:uncharacterized protein PTSG_09507 [Salpingoeca rosetta]EGD77873.1 hypothetical protein PTSG_09507 [Salpingoeca rosetta]|eukprot:XP_004989937.1 hypothetical protein PTSG_09507 [Salpingoeca rosetta]
MADTAGASTAGASTSSANMMRILLATDCHLGYLERDPIRGQDSMRTFEEILQIANRENADMILLGGDLFHENKPSRETLMHTMELFRKYCMGSRPCALQILSDQRINFPRFGKANYMDPNYNVGMPVFSIHGNHDDPSGEQALCALDLLAAANFVNYFGQAQQPDDIELVPICIQKGSTKLALYGLGNIRDERLHRTFLKKKVKWLAPDEDTDDWFNLFVIHQNRCAHGERNYIPETFLPDFVHLTFWGHEHKCEIDPTPRDVINTYITQPGSSVATSLSEGESVHKHVGMLYIRADKSFRITKVPLKTVRAFKFRDLVLAEHLPAGATERDVGEFLAAEVETLLRALDSEHRARYRDDAEARKQMRLPLLRLRVEYTGFPTLGAQRFGQRFAGKVANPKDILLFYRKRTSKPKSKAQQDAAAPTPPDPLEQDKIEDLVEQTFVQSTDPPRLIRPRHFREALSLFVDKDENEALRNMAGFRLERFVDKQLSSAASGGMDVEGDNDNDAVVIGDDEDGEGQEQDGEEDEQTRTPMQLMFGSKGEMTRSKRTASPASSSSSAAAKRKHSAAAAEAANGTRVRKTRTAAATTRGGSKGRKGKAAGAAHGARSRKTRRYDDDDDDDHADGAEMDDFEVDDDEEYVGNGGDASSDDVVTSDGEVLTNYTNISDVTDVTDMSPSPTRRTTRRAAVSARARAAKLISQEAMRESSDDDDDLPLDTTRRTKKRPKRR